MHSADWYGEDISGKAHTRVAFVDLDMTEVTNNGSVFDECTFRGGRFNVSTHTDAAFLNCTACSFFDATFERCKMVGSTFDRCNFSMMKAIGGNWSFVGLPGAHLGNASFDGTNMREVDLVCTDFTGGKLINAELTGTWFHHANLSGCDLRGSNLISVDPATTELKNAIITIDQAIVLATALGLDVRGM